MRNCEEKDNPNRMRLGGGKGRVDTPKRSTQSRMAFWGVEMMAVKETRKRTHLKRTLLWGFFSREPQKRRRKKVPGEEGGREFSSP